MKKSTFAFVLCLMSFLFGKAQNTPFSRGVGFGQAFEVFSPTEIEFNLYNREDFRNVKKLGLDLIRLPIFMANMVDQESGEISPLFFYLLDQYLDMAAEEELNIIVTNMTGYNYNDDPTVKDQLINVWTQVAKHCEERSDKVFYELANEPGYNNIEEWGPVQGELIDSIRVIDPTRTLIVTPAWGGLHHLYDLPEYEDDNLIYTFHFYDPFLFTHQGSFLAGLKDLQGMPFPYNGQSMPELPNSLVGTHYEQEYNDYSNKGTVEEIDELMKLAANFRTERNVPLWCGEFGADDRYSNPEDRTFWYQTVRNSLDKYQISWGMHGYTLYWGLFEYGTSKLFDYDLNIPVVEAMGLNTQAQSEFVIQPEDAGFTIYDDYLNRHVDVWIQSDNGQSHFYSEDDPKDGKFCLQMKDFPVWSVIDFRLQPNRDLSQLVEEGYFLDFWIKGDTPGARINVRFLDSKTDDPDDHPWRMVHDIDETLAPWDGQWHHVQIPLSDFFEQGASDGDWFDPEGKFDWGAINNFQITTEYHDLEGKAFWFDNIRITNDQDQSKSNITLQVNMKNETVGSNVYLRGTFNNWSSNSALVKTEKIYSATLELTPGETIEYKFVNGEQWEEAIPSGCTATETGNRVLQVPGKDTTITVCFNSCQNCVATKIGETQQKSIEFYPNPASNTLNISNIPLEENIQLSLYNTNGSLMFKKIIRFSKTEKVDMTNYSPGVYTVVLSGNEWIKKERIIKLH